MSENANLPFVWVTALTIVYALTCYTMITVMRVLSVTALIHPSASISVYPISVEFRRGSMTIVMVSLIQL